MADLIERGLRWGFGALWIYAGALKLADPLSFLDAVRSFQILGDPWAAIVALALPPLEIFCGLAVVVGRWCYGGALVLLDGALAVFLGALLWGWHSGLDVTCGCFGREENATDYPTKVIQNVGLLGVGGLLLGIWARRMSPGRVKRG
ncbi:hypothetical protein BH23VER1_BH23VER1_21160 [soil metagenome]